jgi:hypothetical protein
MSLRREREREERKRLRVYEAFLALGALVLVGGLAAAAGLVLYGTVLSPRPSAPASAGSAPAEPLPPRSSADTAQ